MSNFLYLCVCAGECDAWPTLPLGRNLKYVPFFSQSRNFERKTFGFLSFIIKVEFLPVVLFFLFVPRRTILEVEIWVADVLVSDKALC